MSQDDQLILIKIGFFEVWLGHVSRLVNSQEGTVTLADGVTLSKQQMDLIFDVMISLSVVVRQQCQRQKTVFILILFICSTILGGFHPGHHGFRRRSESNGDER